MITLVKKSLFALLVVTGVTVVTPASTWAEEAVKSAVKAAVPNVAPIPKAADSKAAALLDINHADAAAIAKGLNGVGLKKAQAIIEYREKFGPFKTVEELAEVKGIGAATIAKNKDRIVLK
jgi:competence protein ComEA